LKIFRNNKITTDKTESVVSDQLSQLNEKEQYFLGLMKKADTTKRPIEELLALSYITQYKNLDIPERLLKLDLKLRLKNMSYKFCIAVGATGVW
jgi:hypothetical protein